MFAVEPHMSQRRAENELEISDTSVQRILKEVRWHPFKMQKIQALELGDLQCRITFAQNQLDLLAAEPDFLNRIDWSDKRIHIGIVVKLFIHLE
uniref:Transposase n=1 Tax=Panagrolaimus sp. ES5 TaxID=591445 RepID=A0AC34FQ12_9BILA